MPSFTPPLTYVRLLRLLKKITLPKRISLFSRPTRFARLREQDDGRPKIGWRSLQNAMLLFDSNHYFAR